MTVVFKINKRNKTKNLLTDNKIISKKHLKRHITIKNLIILYCVYLSNKIVINKKSATRTD